MIHLNLATALLLGLIVFVSGIETASGNRVSHNMVMYRLLCKSFE